MPELPEVETIRRQLGPLITGRRIAGVEVLMAKSCPISAQELSEWVVGAHVQAMRRYAKVLVIELDNDHSLVIHLKMTGQLVFRDDQVDWGAGHPTASLLGQLPDRSTRVIIEWDPAYPGGGPTADPPPADPPARLFVNDQRIFGWIKLVPTAQVAALPVIAAQGPEPVTPPGQPLTGRAATAARDDFLDRVAHRRGTTIKAAILDQHVVAGVGNIYADEALWAARIHPARRVRDLSVDQLGEVFDQAGLSMLRSLDSGGSTMRTYVRPDGSTGNYLDLFANVFARTGQPCRRCGTAVVKTRVAGRGTHLCPACQTLG
jgi:formamidopyrimidine-DNA glycosylase